MSAVPVYPYCDLPREEVDPRYDRFNGTFNPESSIWAPGCGHAACVADPCPGFHGWECPVAACRMSVLEAACELPSGHDGPHQFDPVPEPSPAGAAEREGAAS